MEITYEQLKEFLPNYPDWFERIEKYGLEYEVMYMFNSRYERAFGENYPLNNLNIYTVVCILGESMYEWDI